MLTAQDPSRRRWIVAGTVATGAVGYMALHRLGRISGSTAAERSRLVGLTPHRFRIDSGTGPIQIDNAITATKTLN